MPFPRRFKRPCLDCGRLSRNGSRCVVCQDARERRVKAERPWYRGAWPAISKATIEASPVCADCDETDRDKLTADHVKPRSLELGTVTLCRSCNARRGNRRRVGA